jgi:hypothetical protein
MQDSRARQQRRMMVSVILVAASLLVGCGAEEPGSSSPTWYRDVLPVAQDNCLSCHNDDAPTFSMARFSDELALRAPLMAELTRQGVMPPWKPSRDCNSYHGERGLTPEQIEVFAAWAQAGALPGDPAHAPAPKPAAGGLPWVDVNVRMEAPYAPQPEVGENDELRCFVLDPGLTGPVQLVGYNVVPGDRRVVHHVLLYLADAVEAEALDAADPESGYPCSGGPGVSAPKTMGAWVPGAPATLYPTGTGVPLGADSRIVMRRARSPTRPPSSSSSRARRSTPQPRSSSCRGITS